MTLRIYREKGKFPYVLDMWTKIWWHRKSLWDGGMALLIWQGSARAVLKREQTLALYVHCSASPLIRDVLQWDHYLGILSNQSSKCKWLLAGQAVSDGHTETVEPLCPTRWTLCGQAVSMRLCCPVWRKSLSWFRHWHKGQWFPRSFPDG